MDSGTAAVNLSLDFPPQLLAELGKLQAKFIRGEDVLLPLCRLLAEQSEAEAVLMINADAMFSEDMPTAASCWCRDPVRYLTLWKDVRNWPFAGQEQLVHCWHKFVVWPVKQSNTLVFFHTPSEEWFSFLLGFGDLIAEILMGVFTLQAADWREKIGQQIPSAFDKELFRSIVSNSDDLILVVSRTAKGSSEIIYANAAATCVSLYPRSQLIGQPVSLLFPSGPDNPEAEDLQQALELQRDLDFELYCYRADGERALVQLHLVALEQSSDASLFALLGRDRTEQRQLEQTMARTQKMQAIGQLVGGIAHDFNNILGVLKGNLELVQLKNVEPKLDNYLNTALKACQRGTELTRRLLQFSREEQFNACNCQVNQVISDLQELFAKSLTAKIRLQVKLTPNLPDIRVDTGDLEDALLNLVLNAKDAMNDNGVLTIGTGESELCGFLPGLGSKVPVESGRYVWISVLDSGCGIPLRLLDKIFDPFFTTKDKSKGTGLGLAMTYGFAKRSHGYLNVLHTGSDGTEFRLWFPAVSAKTQPQTDVMAEADLCQVKGKVRALLVDDEVELLRVLTDYCELLGIEVAAYSDPHEVLALSRQGAIDADLLITDVLMPGGINGYELASELDAKKPLSVLLISGFIGDIGVNHHEEMPYKVLHKPFELNGFAQALAEVGIAFVNKDARQAWNS
ncbi:response regulator [Shewanella cyperi]|uniref:histidine kinase n=1 Tax=Shewanella cyperi TaxID=2814292 RepID=A0A974XV43_9GAMM|nr:ATP-binding protein [Shewanella cyperi]QSX30849.1 response regulator [Shewanella cyperi]